MADVVRDLPRALAQQGNELTVLTPAYGLFNQLPNALLLEPLQVHFGGSVHSAELWQLPDANPRIRHLAVEHPLLSPEGPEKSTATMFHSDPLPPMLASSLFSARLPPRWCNDRSR